MYFSLFEFGVSLSLNNHLFKSQVICIVRLKNYWNRVVTLLLTHNKTHLLHYSSVRVLSSRVSTFHSDSDYLTPILTPTPTPPHVLVMKVIPAESTPYFSFQNRVNIRREP